MVATRSKSASEPTVTDSPNTPKTRKNNNTTTSKTKKTTTRTDSAQQKQLTPSPLKRNNSPGVRLLHGRIYDSQNGKTCHQCRQKTVDFAASCKNQRGNMQCTFNFCHKCLINRYGEKAEEVAASENWVCPKCRAICNCSNCMKKRGCMPTGRLADVAKANGCSSVAELLNVKGSEKAVKDLGVSPKKRIGSNEELTADLTRKRLKESEFDGKLNSNPENRPLTTSNRDGLRKRTPIAKHIIKDAGASSKMSTASNKEFVVASTRIREARNGLEVKSDPKTDLQPLEINRNEKETRNKKLIKIRQTDETDNSVDGNRNEGASTEKYSHKNHRIPKEVRKGEMRACIKNNKGQFIKNHSGVKTFKASKQKYTRPIKVEYNEREHQTSLPQGIELANVADIDMPAEDIGNVLQFLEFCEAFGQILHINKGQPASLLRELACGRSSRRAQDSSIVNFHIKLLSMIQKDSGKEYPSLKTGVRNSWVEDLSELISESQCPSKELLWEKSNVNSNGYEELNSSRRLRLLNFLCDEALGTVELRSWIDEKNSEFVEEKKKKALADKKMAKKMKKKMQDEVARAVLLQNGAPLSISEHDNLMAKIKAEVAQTLALTLEGTSIGIEKEQRSDVVRAEPILFDANGRKCWKLKGNPCENDILLQDLGSGDPGTCEERWFIYEVEQKSELEKYMSCLQKYNKNETENGEEKVVA